MKCIKCGWVTYKKMKAQDFICEDCKQHERTIITLYEEARRTFTESSEPIEKTEIFELLKNTYFVVQKNPKLTVYSTLIKELFEEFGIKGSKVIDFDELWRRTKSTRNVFKIVQSMEDAEIIKIEYPNKINRTIKPGKVLNRFINEAYKPYMTQEQAKIRVAAVLTMYTILHEMYLLAKARSQAEIYQLFNAHTPRAPWVATMYLWTERIKEKPVKKEFSEDEIRRFFAKRGLSSTTISNYIGSLKAISPHSLQQYIENIDVGSENNVKFIVRQELLNYLERLYDERVRELDRA